MTMFTLWTPLLAKYLFGYLVDVQTMPPVEKCEGCGDPATTSDGDGVPLCDACAEDLQKETDDE
jgi:hypothetical protein